MRARVLWPQLRWAALLFQVDQDRLSLYPGAVRLHGFRTPVPHDRIAGCPRFMEGARKSKRGGATGTAVGAGAVDGLRVKLEGEENEAAFAESPHTSQSAMSRNEESPAPTPAKRKVLSRSLRPPTPREHASGCMCLLSACFQQATPRAGGDACKRFSAREEGKLGGACG